MTTQTPDSGNVPACDDMALIAVHLSGLLEAMDNQTHLLTTRATPIHSLIFAARPLAQRLADGLSAKADRT